METTILFPGDSEFLKDRDTTVIRPFSIYNSSTGRRRPLYMIVAIGNKDAIGGSGDLLWHLREDLRHFKELTMGHPVIMGRATYLSLPKGALPGRRNIVVSRDLSFAAPGVERAGSPEEALALCEGGEIPFVIGGGQIYKEMLPYTTKIYITRVYEDSPEADTFFPELKDGEWRLVKDGELRRSADGIDYRFQEYDRKE